MTDTIENEITPAAAQITVDEVKNRNHYYSVRELKKLLESCDDDMVVAIHRVEDSYFKSFGQNGWKAIKALWNKHKLSAKQLEYYQNSKDNTAQGDDTLWEIKQNESGEHVLCDYIDAIPAFQAYVSRERGENGQQVLVITPHY